MSNKLRMWTVYDHPKDYPEHFVARLWEVDGDGPQPTGSLIMSGNLETLRHALGVDMHLTCLTRSDMDDPAIVEVWL